MRLVCQNLQRLILMELGAKAKHVWIIGDWNLVILIPADRW
jgi:uncharacterized membrane protein